MFLFLRGLHMSNYKYSFNCEQRAFIFKLVVIIGLFYLYFEQICWVLFWTLFINVFNFYDVWYWYFAKSLFKFIWWYKPLIVSLLRGLHMLNYEYNCNCEQIVFTWFFPATFAHSLYYIIKLTVVISWFLCLGWLLFELDMFMVLIGFSAMCFVLILYLSFLVSDLCLFCC